MSSEISEENAQSDIAIQSLQSHKECVKSQRSTFINMDISDDNPAFKETLHSGATVETKSSHKVGLETVGRHDIPIENEKPCKVANNGCIDENLIARVRDLDISPNKSADAEPTKSQGTPAQEQMSLTFETFLKFSSELSDSSGNEDAENVKMKKIEFLSKRNDDDESLDSELDSESESDDYNSEDEEKTHLKEVQNKNMKKRKVQEESWLSVLGVNKLCAELPDISTLGLNNKEEFIHMGNLECVIEKIVTIGGLPDMPAYDLDTLLFLEEGQKVLGYIFDVMGPVSAPVYIVHMSSMEAIKNLQLQKGTKVYCAPKSKYTKYVFLQELMKMRGSDAGWLGDAEVPSEFQDISDEEQESRSKIPKTERKRQYSQERYREFVTDMNRANERDTRLHRMADTHRLHLERMAGVQSIGQQLRESRLRNQRSGSTNHPPEGRRGRAHFRNNTHDVDTSLPELQDWSVVNPNPLGTVAPSPPSFDPSVPPPSFGTSSRLFVPPFVSFVPPQNVTPRGVDSNRINFRQSSMPGPSNDGGFN